MNRIKQFFEEARVEFRHVNWPTRAEALQLTSVVIGLSIVLAIFLGGFDFLFVKGLNYLISNTVIQ